MNYPLLSNSIIGKEEIEKVLFKQTNNEEKIKTVNNNEQPKILRKIVS